MSTLSINDDPHAQEVFQATQEMLTLARSTLEATHARLNQEISALQERSGLLAELSLARANEAAQKIATLETLAAAQQENLNHIAQDGILAAELPLIRDVHRAIIGANRTYKQEIDPNAVHEILKSYQDIMDHFEPSQTVAAIPPAVIVLLLGIIVGVGANKMELNPFEKFNAGNRAVDNFMDNDAEGIFNFLQQGLAAALHFVGNLPVATLMAVSDLADFRAGLLQASGKSEGLQ